MRRISGLELGSRFPLWGNTWGNKSRSPEPKTIQQQAIPNRIDDLAGSLI